MEIGAVDLVVVIGGWAAGNVVFNGFEQHLPWHRRLLKLVAMLTVFTAVGVLGGRVAFYVLLAVVGFGITVLHAWWFPKHGIHWRTAEPRERYLDLIGRMKSGRH